MIRSYAPALVLVVWALVLSTGVDADSLAIPVLLSAAIATALMAAEFRFQLKGERRSGRDRRRHT